jgi:hypothetical protein
MSDNWINKSKKSGSDRRCLRDKSVTTLASKSFKRLKEEQNKGSEKRLKIAKAIINTIF